MKKKPTEAKEEQTFPLRQIYFYLTKGCNLKCRHCWIAPEYQSPDNNLPVLDLELFHSILKQAKPLGLLGIKLTGGEPLLHPQINEILETVRCEKLNLAVETNGILCTPEIADKMRESTDKLSVSVSLDGFDAETHDWVRGVDGSFEAALAGVRNLVKAGVNPQIIMSVMRKNKEHVEPIVRLAEQLEASSVKFNPVQPTARGDAMHKAMETLTIEELYELGIWVEDCLSTTTDLRLVYTRPMAFRPLSKMFGDNGNGCGTCGILGILGVLADGSYSLCGIGEHVPDLVFGHADEDRLEHVWTKSQVLEELREGFPTKMEGICGDCLMNAICKGSCIAQNYYRNNNLWAPYWYCEEAQKAGIFPETRLRVNSI